MSNKADSLSNANKLFYANKALAMYWAVVDKSSFPSNATYEWFVDQVFTDQSNGKNYRNEDMPEFGKIVAIYLLDHPYPSEDKLRSGYQNLAKATPKGKIPSKYGLSKVISNASLYTSAWDILGLTKEAAFDTYKDFKGVIVAGAVTYSYYKVATVTVAGIVAFTTLYKLFSSDVKKGYSTIKKDASNGVKSLTR